METIIHKVRDLSEAARASAEQLVGHSLDEGQQLVIEVHRCELTRADEVDGIDDALPAWLNVYEGLTESRIDELEKAISRRLDLSRPVK
ncbi:MAG: hypothetical protein L0211_21180 [Planctomycetaceae bacterium]|nr:hypothetical protein [Planctomycetaceae bacterium]